MRVFFISYHYNPPDFGGGLIRMIKHLESLQTNGHKITVLTSGVPGYPKQSTENGIFIQRSAFIHNSKIGRGLRRILFPLWAGYRVLGSKPDIIHLQSLGGIHPIVENMASLFFGLVAKIIRTTIIKQHTLADSEEKIFRVDGIRYRLRLIAYKQFDAIVSVSPALHQAVRIYLPRNSYCIINGVDADLFAPISEKEREAFRKINAIKEDQVVFTFLGSVSRRKGFDLLSNAFSELNSNFPHWRLWVIGPRNREENQNLNEVEVKEILKPLENLAGKVKFWGRIDNNSYLSKVLGASDVFVFPSRKEGFGNAPVEAMACGIPPIIARIPGVTDLANIENVTGLYCQVHDLDSLKEAMIKLGSDHQLRKKMGIAARKRVLDTFNWKRYIQNWENLYQELLIKKS